jgi:integrase/recombinase XerD
MKITDVEALPGRYLAYCEQQKQLNGKTLKAYRIDLRQYITFSIEQEEPLGKITLLAYIAHLHASFQPKTAKRKIACLKAFCSWLEYEELLPFNPFQKIQTKFREPFHLPRTIPIDNIQQMLSEVYNHLRVPGLTSYQQSALLRDAVVMELLFATGIRVSELCALKLKDFDLCEGHIKIYGKGAKERMIQIGNPDVLAVLQRYNRTFADQIKSTGHFFVNRLGNQLSEQSVRQMLKKYADLCGLDVNITPHMFRYSFATLLLEEDVDIRYIQKMLGHSSIVTTQIYTHVAAKKQKDILTAKHPRNRLMVNTG